MKPMIVQVSFPLLIYLIISLSSCNQKTEEQLIQEKLIGDWTSLDTCRNKESYHGCNNLLLSFNKELFRSKIIGEPNFVHIHNKIILIKTTLDNDHTYWMEYRLIHCGKKFLKLKPKSPDAKNEVGRILNHPWKGETITLRKCRKRNSIQPDKIVFYATACYGTCPQFYLEIKANKHIRYLGETFTKKGSYTRSIPKGDYELLKRRIQQIPIKKMKSDYHGCVADAPNYYLTVFYGKKYISYRTDMCKYTPAELQIVLYQLLDFGGDTTTLVKSEEPFHYSDFDLADFNPRPVEMSQIPFPR